jgi:hypothetical protein
MLTTVQIAASLTPEGIDGLRWVLVETPDAGAGPEAGLKPGAHDTDVHRSGSDRPDVARGLAGESAAAVLVDESAKPCERPGQLDHPKRANLANRGSGRLWLLKSLVLLVGLAGAWVTTQAMLRASGAAPAALLAVSTTKGVAAPAPPHAAPPDTATSLSGEPAENRTENR